MIAGAAMRNPCAHQVVTLSDGRAEVDVLPLLGAAIGRYSVRDSGSEWSVFMPTAFGEGASTRDVASILLVPWSNRIGGGGFECDGKFVPLEPNLPGEAFPIHGNAFQARWRVVDRHETVVRLCLDSLGPSEFRYRAEVTYTLSDGCLGVDLAVTNRAGRVLPFGLGIHPWLPRTPETELRFTAGAVWLEDDRHLAAGRLDIADNPEWDFSVTRRLPANWINNAFDRWEGRADIRWPEWGKGLRVEASRELSTCIVYSPTGDAPFFCFEPVSHPVDAHSRTDGGELGLKRLAPDDTMRSRCRFEPYTL